MGDVKRCAVCGGPIEEPGGSGRPARHDCYANLRAENAALKGHIGGLLRGLGQVLDHKGIFLLVDSTQGCGCSECRFLRAAMKAARAAVGEEEKG